MAEALVQTACAVADTPEDRWKYLQRHVFTPDQHSFALQREAYERIYGENYLGAPVWYPPIVSNTHCEQWMNESSMETYEQLYDFSIRHRDEFWCRAAERIGIVWDTPPTRAFGMDKSYFPHAKWNIVDSMLRDTENPAAVVFQRPNNNDIERWSTECLTKTVNQVASAVHATWGVGARIGVCMPLTPESIAIYMGIVKAGGIVVSIADSFSSKEMAIRCDIAGVVGVITQDVIVRPNKTIPLYGRVVQAVRSWMERTAAANDTRDNPKEDAHDGKETKEDHTVGVLATDGLSSSSSSSTIPIIVVPALITTDDIHIPLQVPLEHETDRTYGDFLHNASTSFESIPFDGTAPSNILFSSGTTGTPKAIVWTHATPIKSAVDGYFHQNLNSNDIICWPTSLGWMMGSWLIAQRIHGTTLALYAGLPQDWPRFTEFLETAQVTMLGVIPSLVATWYSQYHDTFRLPECITRYSSTGEASDPVVYHWLMSRKAGYAPVIEYCGGTEIGGSFLSSVLCLPNVPSHFNTAVLGSEIRLMDPETQEILTTTKNETILRGELALVPPTVGYSTVLLNRNHDECYYAGMPILNGVQLRRHGDAFEKCSSLYRALGRCDDTMNLGGIKVSSVELERVVKESNLHIADCAAIGVGHPSQLVVYAVCHSIDREVLLKQLQRSIKQHLNPLFHLRDLVLVDSLPRTASNKILRRVLRDAYGSQITTQ